MQPVRFKTEKPKLKNMNGTEVFEKNEQFSVLQKNIYIFFLYVKTGQRFIKRAFFSKYCILFAKSKIRKTVFKKKGFRFFLPIFFGELKLRFWVEKNKNLTDYKIFSIPSHH